MRDSRRGVLDVYGSERCLYHSTVSTRRTSSPAGGLPELPPLPLIGQPHVSKDHAISASMAETLVKQCCSQWQESLSVLIRLHHLVRDSGPSYISRPRNVSEYVWRDSFGSSSDCPRPYLRIRFSSCYCPTPRPSTVSTDRRECRL